MALTRARQAPEMRPGRRARLSCWSVAGRRLGAAKDVRVLIAKAAWAEVWRWGACRSCREGRSERAAVDHFSHTLIPFWHSRRT
jgi:hypothetical protein